MPLKYYMDEQVENAITRELRRLGIDALRVQDDGRSSTDDEIILDRAAALGRVVVTRDDDFLGIARKRQINGIPFPGVVYARLTTVSIGRCVKDLEIMAGVYEPGDMLSMVVYLPL